MCVYVWGIGLGEDSSKREIKMYIRQIMSGMRNYVIGLLWLWLIKWHLVK